MMSDREKRFFGGKVTVRSLPVGGPYRRERRFVNERGEMAQIADDALSPFSHLVYIEILPGGAETERGHHYHDAKVETLYVIKGRLGVGLEDLGSGDVDRVVLEGGDKIRIFPGVAHAYKALEYTQALEYTCEAYNEADTKPYRMNEPPTPPAPSVSSVSPMSPEEGAES